MERYLPLEEAIDRNFRFMKIAREYSEEDLYSEETLAGEYIWSGNGQKAEVHRAELEHGHDAEGSTERRRVCGCGNRIH